MSVANLLSLDEVKDSGSRLTRLEFIQRPPDKNISGESFNQSDFTFRFTVSGNQWWIPAKTFFATRCAIRKDNDEHPITALDFMAPSPLMMSGLFRSVDFRIANKSVAKVNSRLPQIEACRKRLTKSAAWRSSQGRANFFEGELK